MKRVFTGLLLLLSLAGQAQTDAHKLMADYFPMADGHLLFKAYNMEPDIFLNTMHAYKAKAYALAGTDLAKKEIDCYCLLRLKDYSLYYGTDSIKQEAFYKLLEKKGIPSDSVAAAQRATRLKNLTPEQRVMLDSVLYKNVDFNDSALFAYSASYKAYLYDVLQHMMFTDFRNDFFARVDQSVIKLKAANKYITNEYINNYFNYALSGLIIKTLKDSVLKDSIYHAFMQKVNDGDYRRKMDSVYSNYLAFGDNKMAPGFTYMAVNGKPVSLESLRGKYVYIDVWATWCGPCKKEIPSLMEVEKRYAGKDIVFVSLSVDVPADKGKWRKYVLDNHLEGIQVMADNAFDSDFIKKFNIASIPRFILIDPKGRIVSANAMRPSDAGLTAQLDGLVK